MIITESTLVFHCSMFHDWLRVFYAAHGERRVNIKLLWSSYFKVILSTRTTDARSCWCHSQVWLTDVECGAERLWRVSLQRTTSIINNIINCTIWTTDTTLFHWHSKYPLSSQFHLPPPSKFNFRIFHRSIPSIKLRYCPTPGTTHVLQCGFSTC